MESLSIQEINTRRPRCPRCGCLADMVWIASTEERRCLAVIRGEEGAIAFARALREATGCSIAEAKATDHHLTTRAAGCHRCKEPLPIEGIVDCPKCHSANLVYA